MTDRTSRRTAEVLVPNLSGPAEPAALRRKAAAHVGRSDLER